MAVLRNQAAALRKLALFFRNTAPQLACCRWMIQNEGEIPKLLELHSPKMSGNDVDMFRAAKYLFAQFTNCSGVIAKFRVHVCVAQGTNGVLNIKIHILLDSCLHLCGTVSEQPRKFARHN
jgi:hypothetical protein